MIKPHEGAAVTGELFKSIFTAPQDGHLQCFVCGYTRYFNPLRPYDEQSSCGDPDCDGQMFCNKWPHWRNGRKAAGETE